MQTKTAPAAGAEQAGNILQPRGNPLDAMFAPQSIALLGATEAKGSVGRTILQNLTRGEFKGEVFPVNPKRETVLGRRAFPTVGSIGKSVDLAVVVTPAPTVPSIIKECSALGIPAAIIISAGFKEIGPAGAELERQVYQEAQKGKMRIIGPNCLGLMRPGIGLNATFAASMARPGSVGFISQSGALCTAILDWSFQENVGFSAFVSIGSMLDVGWGDLIYYLGDDPQTKSIVIYMESIGDARAFLSAAREIALTKPIIVLKAGRSDAAAKAAASHTGALTGSDEVLHAAFRRVGVLRVDTISELFDLAEVLGKQPRPAGPRLGIVTNAGGPAVLATDMLISSGGQLAEISPATLAALNEVLPAAWSHNNPIDVLGDAGLDRYAKAIEIAAQDPNNDGLLVILTPQAMTDPSGTANELKRFAHLPGKPILASWMGAQHVHEGEMALNRINIPTFKFPDHAAKTFAAMWRYSYNLRALYESPALEEHAVETTARRDRATALLGRVATHERTLLTEHESKRLLEIYNIPTVETHVAATVEEAVTVAEKLGFPVVLKLHSESITHKTDVGGVQLNLSGPKAVRDAWRIIETSVARLSQGNGKSGKHDFLGVTVQPMIKLEGYELILGSSIDPQFGPVLLFGAGGQLVEVFKDRALGLPPLNATLARRMMEQTRIYQALKGVRGRAPVDLGALEQLLTRFSQLVAEQRHIAEIDINPLLAGPKGLLALDARVVIHSPGIAEDALPKPAIRPYPTQYVSVWKSRNGTPLTLRPIRPEDEPLMVNFHEALSEQSVYNRYFSPLQLPQRIAHERLTRICFNDYDREIALVVDHHAAGNRHHEILGVGRLSKISGTKDCEFALLVRDQWQNQGLGGQLLKSLIQIGRNEKLDRIQGIILSENRAMQHVCRKAGFQIHFDKEAGEFSAVLELAHSIPALANHKVSLS
jgi:acetyltransferase